MGLFVLSLHFQGTTQEKVVDAYREQLPGHCAFISPVANDWITVFDDCDVESACSAICRACGCPAIGILVCDSDYLAYWLLDSDGRLRDKSEPLDDANMGDAERLGVAGRIEMIAELLKTKTAGADLRQRVQGAEAVDAAFWALVDALDVEYTGVTYSDLLRACRFPEDDEGLSEIWPWSQFVHVGGPDPRCTG